ncbi:MAG: ankyrin repeat domain-containing protein [Moorea sp. SIO3C2]|nr:ankyrin repeat domain-containing protein [Moorena sp. SIO3C2]
MAWVRAMALGRERRLIPCGAMVLLCLLAPFFGGCTSVAEEKSPEASMTTTVAQPPLITATLAGDAEQVRQLLQQGTDPNQVYGTNTALIYASRDGFSEIVQILIEAGADVNWIDGEGVTPLILAAFKNHPAIVQMLLDQGADTSIRDQWSRTALDYALRRGADDAIVHLLQ